jgi:hypothetical protein
MFEGRIGSAQMAHADEEPDNVRYRRLAQQYLDTPLGTLPPHARTAVREMAETWLRLAEEYEKRLITPAGPSEAQPVGQQQQQIQPKEPEGDAGPV